MPATLAEIRTLIASYKMPQALQQLEGYVAEHCPHFAAEVIGLKGKYAKLKDLENRGVLFPQDIPTHYSQHIDLVTRTLTRIVDGEQPEDKDPQEAPSVEVFHGYTVNREDQLDGWSARQSLGEQCQFFILQGDDRHEHEHFFERIAHDLMGHFRDVDNPFLLNDCTVERLSPYAVRYRDNPEDYRKEILRKLYDKAGLDANAHAPLLDKSLDYFRKQAPRTSPLRLGDYVTVFFRLEDLDEAPDKAAETVRWFIDFVAQNPLPPEAPSFLFFFSFEFDESYPDEAEEVRNAVAAIEGACVIQEFHKVGSRDVVKWLKRYRKVIPDGQNPRKFGEQLFARDNQFYMADVNPELQRLINDYNESL